MAISSVYTPPQYTGDGSTTQFAFPYAYFAAGDLEVTLWNPSAEAFITPAPALNGAGTYDYSVTGTQDQSGTGEYLYGTVTLNTAPPAGYSVTLYRAVPPTQGCTLTDFGPFPAKTIEAAFDRLTVLYQQALATVARSLVVPPGDPETLTLTLPPASVRAGQTLMFDASGNATVGQPAATGVAVSTPMQSLLVSASLALAFNSLAAAGAVTASPSIAFPPQGNPTSTYGSLVVQATANQAATREFLAAFNLYTGVGSGAASGTADKVALYAGTEGVAGSADMWSLNTLTSMDSTFPATSYALGYECDFNNFAQDRGTTVGTGGFAGATSTGLLVTGSSTHWNTSGISVEGDNAIQWERGVSVINAGQASFFDWSQATIGLVMYGTHTVGIDLSPMTGAGGSASAIRLGNNTFVVARNAGNTADVPLIELNAANNVSLGGTGTTGVYINVANLVPASDNATSLGISSLRWQQVWSVNGTIQTSDPSLKTDIRALPAALPLVLDLNPVSYKWRIGGHDLTDTTETQLVHATEERTETVPHIEMRNGQAIQTTKTVTHTVHLYDDVPVHDEYGNPVMIHVPAQPELRDPATGRITRPAIPARTFQQTHREPRMVQQPVTTTKPVPRAGKRDHLGFLATDVRDALAKHMPGVDAAAYVQGEDGSHHLRPDQLVPLLWKAVQELAARVTALEAKPA